MALMRFSRTSTLTRLGKPSSKKCHHKGSISFEYGALCNLNRLVALRLIKAQVL